MTVKNDRADAAKAAILRRRAFFVTSALTAVGGCGKEEPPQVPPVDVPPAPTASATATATASATPTAAPTASLPERDIPSLDVPAGVNETAKGHYEHLVASVPELHATLDAAASTLRGLCEPKSEGCNGDWIDVAKQLAEVERRIERLRPRCQGDSEDAKAFMKRLAEHVSVLKTRRRDLDEAVVTWLDDAGRLRWAESQKAAAIPRPCLKYACKPW